MKKKITKTFDGKGRIIFPILAILLAIAGVALFCLPFVCYYEQVDLGFLGTPIYAADYTGFDLVFGNDEVVSTITVGSTVTSSTTPTEVVWFAVIGLSCLADGLGLNIISFITEKKWKPVILGVAAISLVTATVFAFLTYSGFTTANAILEENLSAYSIGTGAIIVGGLTGLSAVSTVAGIVIK